MTRLDERKSRLLIETSDTVRERGALREVVLEPQPYYVVVRLKGLRSRFPISYAAIWNQAVKIEVERQRAEKKSKKRGKFSV